ncbi:MAG TPA: ribonuclease T [Hyphomicrobium sp.]|jgi:ribonuclease T2|nr:ribonuclease T [Hyphomicrobium sp.]
MLKPHLLLTALVLLLVAGLAVHMGRQQNWQWSTVSPGSSPEHTANANSSGSGNGYGSGDGYRNSYGNDGERNVPGQFDYYALVLSWSPTYCAEKGGDDDAQCNRRDGRRYSFVLHGLWPQYEHGYPSQCRLSRRPFVPENVITSMLDIMPSRGLVIHEYRTHGTCSGLDPARYFATAHRLFDGINIPQRFRNPFESQLIAPSDIRREFLQANPNFKPDMIAIVCGGAGKGLKEVRFCVSKDGQPRTCGQNENQGKLCSTDRVFIPPTRSTARQDSPDRRSVPANAPADTNPASTGQQSPLPGPRMDYDYGRRAQ